MRTIEATYRAIEGGINLLRNKGQSLARDAGSLLKLYGPNTQISTWQGIDSGEGMSFECEQFCRFTNRQSCTGSLARSSQMVSISTKYFLFPCQPRCIRAIGSAWYSRFSLSTWCNSRWLNDSRGLDATVGVWHQLWRIGIWPLGTRHKTHQAQPQVHGRRSSQETDCGGNSGGTQEIRMTRSWESWIKQHPDTETSLRSNCCNCSTCTGSWAKRRRVLYDWLYSKLLDLMKLYEFVLVSAVKTQPILVSWTEHLLGCYSTQGKCGTSSSIAGIWEK